MVDQTRPEWRNDAGSFPKRPGTLVIFSDVGLTDYLEALAREFKSTLFRWPDEPDFIKLYLNNVDYGLVARLDLQLFEFSWMPDWVTDIFVGRCGGDDCAASKQCAQPGCQCRKGRCR